MTISRATLSLIGVGALLFTACGDNAAPADTGTGGDTQIPDLTLPSPNDADADLAGSWMLVSGMIDGSPIILVDGWEVTLTIDVPDIGGRAACNGYGGSVDVDVGNGTFYVGELSWTEMGCEPAVMDLEQSYLRSLSAATSFALTNDVLMLTGSAVELLFDPVAPVADTAIVGTTWVLDTVIQGDAASNSPLMSAATLTLNDDRTLTGSTGCRLLEGEWVTAGAEIVFTSFSAIDDPLAGVCAPESLALEGIVISVLGDGFTAEIDGQRLTLMAQGNEGLSYTAE